MYDDDRMQLFVVCVVLGIKNRCYQLFVKCKSNLPPRETTRKPIGTESFQKGEGDGKSTEQQHQIGYGM